MEIFKNQYPRWCPGDRAGVSGIGDSPGIGAPTEHPIYKKLNAEMIYSLSIKLVDFLKLISHRHQKWKILLKSTF